MEDLSPQKIQLLEKELTPEKLKAFGLPINLNPASAVTSLIKRLVPNLGSKILKKIFQRLTGSLTGGQGIFGKLFKIIVRVIDAILGVLVGIIGGAILGGAGVGFAGLSGGLSGLATEPTTIHVNTRDSDNYVIHGDKAHKNKGFSFSGNQEKGSDSDQRKDPHSKEYEKIEPDKSKINFLD